MIVIILCGDCKKTSAIHLNDEYRINVLHCPECKSNNITYLDSQG